MDNDVQPMSIDQADKVADTAAVRLVQVVQDFNRENPFGSGSLVESDDSVFNSFKSSILESLSTKYALVDPEETTDMECSPAESFSLVDTEI